MSEVNLRCNRFRERKDRRKEEREVEKDWLLKASPSVRQELEKTSTLT